MYCRMCGRKIGDTDLFCQFCGTPTGRTESVPASAEPKEEIIFNPPYEDKSRPTEEEELKDYISENEIEEAQKQEIEEAQKKEIEDEEETAVPEPAKNPEFTWNLYEFPTEKKKTEEVEFNWNMDDYGQPEQKEPEAKSFEEELFQEIREDSNRIKEQNIDRFFTFSRKSEEFQELLDREYEKFRMRTVPPAKCQEEEPIKETAEEQPDKAIEAEKAETIREVEAEEVEAIKEVEAEKAEAIEENEAVKEVQPEEAKAEITEPEAAPRSGHISEMELARAQYFGEELIRDNESIRKKLTPGEPEKAENHIEIPETEEVKEEYDSGEAESAEVEPSDNTDAIIEEKAEIEEPEKPRRSIGQIVLAIIAVILVIEIVILGIRYFAPDSSAGKAIRNTQTQIFNTVAGWFDGGSAQGNDSEGQEALPEDSDQTDQDNVGGEKPPADTKTEPPVADSNPIADKNALVSSQLGNNKNIEQVKANEALVWKQGVNYGLSDINNSKPISNNIWQAPETGDPIYYDKSVVGAVIAFDSKWIDYVNSGDKSVLSLLKKDSEAYRKSVNYSKVGKIKETFKLLEIGEIRQGANGFYIWVHEEIGATENGKTTDLKYNWIYYLEPEDGQMKIVNYYQFK